MSENYYHILGISEDASPSEIRKAYLALAKQYHPDINPEDPNVETRFKKINEAYQTLNNPSKKFWYDSRKSYDAFKGHNTGYQRYQQPYRSGRTKPNRWKYNKGILMYGHLFVVGLILIVVVIPVLLFYFNSKYQYSLGMEAFHEGDYSGALVRFQQAMVHFGGKNVEAGIMAGRIELFHHNDPLRALGYLNQTDRYSESRSSYAMIHYLKGLAYQRMKDFNSARLQLKESISYNFEFDSVHFSLGVINLVVYEDMVMAKKNFSDVIGINPEYTEAYFNRGLCHYHLEEFDSAIQDFQQFILMDDKNGAAHLLKGMAEVSIGRMDAACSDFKIAEEKGVKDADAYYIINCESDN